MGRWMYYPMASDSALDNQYYLLQDLTALHRDRSWDYSDSENEESTKKYLESLTLRDLKRIIKYQDVNNNNLFIVTFTYIDYGAKPKNKNVKEFLRQCLDSVAELSNLEESMKYIDICKLHFDSIIDQKVKLLKIAPRISYYKGGTNGNNK